MGDWSGRFEYTETNVKKYAPVSAGVYRLVYKKDNDSYIVFYIGKGDDSLERRLLEHLATSEQNSCIKRHINNYSCYFRFLEVTTQAERDKIEEQQIGEYTPSCNTQLKEG